MNEDEKIVQFMSLTGERVRESAQNSLQRAGGNLDRALTAYFDTTGI